MSSNHLRFVGADRLPRTLSEFDVARFFSLLPDDAKEIRERFRAARHSPSTLTETMDKVRVLKKLGTPDWNLDAIHAAHQAAYAQAIANRPPLRAGAPRTSSMQAAPLGGYPRLHAWPSWQSARRNRGAQGLSATRNHYLGGVARS